MLQHFIYLSMKEVKGWWMWEVGWPFTGYKQAAQRLLYHKDVAWAHTARLILKNAGGLGFDKHLFIMDLEKVNLSKITLFYKSVLQSWKTVFNVDRNSDDTGHWVLEEPLFFNLMIQTRLLSSVSVSTVLKRNGVVKLDNFWRMMGGSRLISLKKLLVWNPNVLYQSRLRKFGIFYQVAAKSTLKEIGQWT